jgi:hypothetical protein
MADLMRVLGFRGSAAQLRPVSVRKRAGFTRTTGPFGEIVECDILVCCHCRFTWEVIVGSGIQRGFCAKCCGYTCGKPECNVCVPFEQRLENEEAGRDRLTISPLAVAVPALPKTLILSK